MRRLRSRFRASRKHLHHCRGVELLEPRQLLAGDMVGRLVADDLRPDVGDGAVIEQWVDVVSQESAIASGQPTLIHDRFSGRAAIRFDASDGDDAFRIDKTSSPVVAAEDFSVMVAFATSGPTQGSGMPWFAGTGLVDANTLGLGQDWGMTLTNDGQASAGLGAGGAVTATVKTSQDSLVDGLLHSLVFTRQGGSIALYVDSQLAAEADQASTDPRSRLDVTIGDIQTGGAPFTGDIAEVRFFDGALSDTEVADLHAEIVLLYDNSAPVAHDDQYQFDEDQLLTIIPASRGVLQNDTDVEGDVLTVTMVENAQHGSVALNDDGSFIYSSRADFFGIDSFRYVARDSRDSNVAVVTLDVANVYDPASAVDDVYRMFPTEVLDVVAADGLLTNDVNVDQVALTAVLVSEPNHGQLRLRDDGSFLFDPQGQAGLVEFSYLVDDGVQRSAPAQVQVIVNSQPIAEDDSYIVAEDELLVISPADGLLANDVDADGDALSVELVLDPTNGELGLAENGSFIYMPRPNFFGDDSFQYRVSDGDRQSDIATAIVKVESINDAPQAADDVFFTPADGLQLEATLGVLRNDTDTEGDALVARLETEPTNGTLQLQESGALAYRPSDGFEGIDRFTYRAHDGDALSEPTEVTLYVGQSPLVISEVMAGNVTLLETRLRASIDDDFPRDRLTPDWIELHNLSNAAIDAGGFYLSDEEFNPRRWQIPAETWVPPNGFALVFASGKDVRDPQLDELGIVHTNFSLNLRDEQISLAFPDGRVAESIELGQQYPEISFAVVDGAGQYFAGPTPGEANTVPLDGVVQPVTFSHGRGYYTDSFALELSTATTDSEIRYTIDGTAPTSENGEVYSGPIAIDTTATIRAAAFLDRHLASAPRTQSYLFLADVINQPDSRAGYPTEWARMTADYGMDPDVVGENNLFEDRYRNTIIDDLQSLPALSLVFNPDDIFGRQGIYQNPTASGDRWERPTSVEFFDPATGEAGFHLNSGIRVMGGSSRQPDIPKHSFRLEFREQYGEGKLQYPLYQDAPFSHGATETFDELVVRVGFNNSWMHRHYYQGLRGEQPRDQWLRDLQFAMGHHSTRGRYAHVYLNGMYWGIYNLQERPAAPFFEEYFGGDKDTDWDVINSNEPIDGDSRAWRDATRNARTATTPEGYEAYQEQVDVVNLADYMLLNFYVGNTDWDGHNWISAKQKPDQPWRFYAWDSEFAISLPPSNTAIGENAERQIINVNKTGQSSGNGPSGIHQQLARNEEYRMMFADRVQKHMFHDGVLTPDHATRLFLHRIAEIDRAVVAESARWGDHRRDVNAGRWRSDQFDLFTRDEHFLAQQEFIVDRYLPVRTGIVLEQLRRRNMYPDVAAPELNQRGGLVAPGFELTIQAGEGQVYFTLDGTDPRQVGGEVAPEAQVYDGSITLNHSVTLKARVLLGDEWSALTEVDFRVAAPATIDSLRVSEVHYHPADETPSEAVAGFTDADDFEFLELVNVGDVNADLATVAFTRQTVGDQSQGIEFAFSQADVQELAPGDRLVIVEDLAAFRFRYGDGPRVAGQWSGGLSNRSETITMEIDGQVALAFAYSDDWHPATDGQGHSLVAVDPADNDLSQWGRAAGWQSSFAIGGSPGATDTQPGDANADGVFDSSDLVQVFRAGEYEDDVVGNSTFEEGDWDGDGDFTTGDLVVAFRLGMYVAGATVFDLLERHPQLSTALDRQSRELDTRRLVDQVFEEDQWNEALELKLALDRKDDSL